MKNSFGIIVLILVLLLCSCSNSKAMNRAQSNSDVSTDQHSSFNEQSKEVPLEELLTESYSIIQLQNYFGPYCTTAENNWHGIVENMDIYKYKNIVEVFPNGCIRTFQHEDRVSGKMYLVYKVSEGGYYYLDLGSFSDTNSYYNYPETEKRSASFMIYVPEKPMLTIEDFEKLEIGVNTAEDVGKLDISSQFFFGMGRGVASWHLLSDGNIVEIMYTEDDIFHESHLRTNLYINSIEVMDAQERAIFLSQINPNDLPHSNIK